MTKRIVHYRGDVKFERLAGITFAFLYPCDHPDSARVSNEKLVITSPVVSYNIVTGCLETQNTVYVRQLLLENQKES
jgi:hypothetical protein